MDDIPNKDKQISDGFVGKIGASGGCVASMSMEIFFYQQEEQFLVVINDSWSTEEKDYQATGILSRVEQQRFLENCNVVWERQKEASELDSGSFSITMEWNDVQKSQVIDNASEKLFIDFMRENIDEWTARPNFHLELIQSPSDAVSCSKAVLVVLLVLIPYALFVFVVDFIKQSCSN